MKSLHTTFDLPPGFLTPEKVRTLLHLMFEEYQWIKPKRYGNVDTDLKLPSGRNFIDTLVSYYIDEQCLSLDSGSHCEWLSILPDRRDGRSYFGSITWATFVKPASYSPWRLAHIKQVFEIMKLLNSPLVLSALETDMENKFFQWIPDADNPDITIHSPTVSSYAHGLAGLFWRNFYGPPFSQMFGERLNSLPQNNAQDFGDGYWLVEPYPLPTDVENDEGHNKEKRLIKLLNPKCFYNFETNTLPSVLPDLPELIQDRSEKGGQILT